VAGWKYGKKFKTGKSEYIIANKTVVKEKHPVVIVERGWKDYLGECLLIVFSVILALAVTEFINNLNDKKRTHEILHQLKEELTDNLSLEKEQYNYHLQIVKRLDSAINDASMSAGFITNGLIHIDKILPAPHRVLLHDLYDGAWQIAKQNNVISKIDFSTYSLLNDIYNNQARITNSEDKIAQVLLSYDSRKPENLRTTLILAKDNYYGWDVERAPRLIELYQKAINILSKY
jgi:hypothetical protein